MRPKTLRKRRQKGSFSSTSSFVARTVSSLNFFSINLVGVLARDMKLAIFFSQPARSCLGLWCRGMFEVMAYHIHFGPRLSESKLTIKSGILVMLNTFALAFLIYFC